MRRPRIHVGRQVLRDEFRRLRENDRARIADGVRHAADKQRRAEERQRQALENFEQLGPVGKTIVVLVYFVVLLAGAWLITELIIGTVR